ncbi:hypothetical protein Salat_2882300 [Sesamum alatum]|uniref:Uncharacterized protein n=1 Tax=Sesamum alatum TaxID=300844 RepID=A0AAE2C890_9LAMI|nr:hypothetical protein Salat_2882300 [Sesamum alatum]
MANDEPPLDDIESGNGSVVVGCPSSEEENALNRLFSEFNLSEFLALASRVIDAGDIASLEAISDLKRRWNEKFGEFQPRPSMVARPSSSRTLTPFRPITAPTRACTSYSTHANDRTNECVSTTHSLGGRIISCSSSLIAAVVHGFLDFSGECCGCNPSAAIHYYSFGRLPTRYG